MIIQSFVFDEMSECRSENPCSTPFATMSSCPMDGLGIVDQHPHISKLETKSRHHHSCTLLLIKPGRPKQGSPLSWAQHVAGIDKSWKSCWPQEQIKVHPAPEQRKSTHRKVIPKSFVGRHGNMESRHLAG